MEPTKRDSNRDRWRVIASILNTVRVPRMRIIRQRFPQNEMVEALGVSGASVGASTGATLETDVAGRSATGKPVCANRFAAKADGILIVAGVKPHTAFRHAFESGMM